jgi:hypothetical protein
MISRREFHLASLVFAVSSAKPLTTLKKPLKALIVDGVNNHDWRTGTAAMRAVLIETNLFHVDLSTTPPREAAASAWEVWDPDFSRYDVVINNFNGGHTATGLQWPTRVETSLEKYVKGGGGLVVFHAANNAFLLWPAYNDMIGLGWREPAFGRGIQISSADEVVFIPRGSGLEPGHPDRMDFQMHVRETGHPITQGMPTLWMHPLEQLTHGQHGPAEDLTILTYAHSPVSQANEPMDWTKNYGKGRVYTTMLGHTWIGESRINLDCVGWQTLFVRGVEWAATGKVTGPIPANFPGAKEPSLRALNLA